MVVILPTLENRRNAKAVRNAATLLLALFLCQIPLLHFPLAATNK